MNPHSQFTSRLGPRPQAGEILAQQATILPGEPVFETDFGPPVPPEFRCFPALLPVSRDIPGILARNSNTDRKNLTLAQPLLKEVLR
jgi:hypothetical protein